MNRGPHIHNLKTDILSFVELGEFYLGQESFPVWLMTSSFSLHSATIIIIAVVVCCWKLVRYASSSRFSSSLDVFDDGTRNNFCAKSIFVSIEPVPTRGTEIQMEYKYMGQSISLIIRNKLRAIFFTLITLLTAIIKLALPQLKVSRY